jgi:hypothetical protein
MASNCYGFGAFFYLFRSLRAMPPTSIRVSPFTGDEDVLAILADDGANEGEG